MAKFDKIYKYYNYQKLNSKVQYQVRYPSPGFSFDLFKFVLVLLLYFVALHYRHQPVQRAS